MKIKIFENAIGYNHLVLLLIVLVGIFIGEETASGDDQDIKAFKIVPKFIKGEIYQYKIFSQTYIDLKEFYTIPETAAEYSSTSEIKMEIVNVNEDGTAEITFSQDTGTSIIQGLIHDIAPGVGKEATVKLFSDGRYEEISGELTGWIRLFPFLLYNRELIIGEPVELTEPSKKSLMSGELKAECKVKLNKYKCLKIMADVELNLESKKKPWLNTKRIEASQYYLAYEKGYLVIKAVLVSFNEDKTGLKEKKKSITATKTFIELI